MTSEVQHLGLVDRDRAALNLVRHAGKVPVIVMQIGDLRGGLLQDLAVVPRLEQCQFWRVLLDKRRQVEDQPRALGLCDVTPLGHFERCLRSRDRLIYLGWRAISDAVPLSPCRGFKTWQLRSRTRIKPLTIDKDR